MDPTLGIDEVAVAHRILGILLPRCASDLIRRAHSTINIAQQVERELLRFGEREVLSRCVERNAEDDGMELLESVGTVTQALTLDRSTRCRCFRIPPQQHPLPPKIAEVDVPAMFVRQFEIWRYGVHGQHRRSLADLEALSLAKRLANLPPSYIDLISRAMPYDKNDPRSQLSTAGIAPSGIPRPAHYREFHEADPDEKHTHGSNTWWTRSQAMVIGSTDAQPDDDLTTIGIAGEHAVLVIDGAALQVTHEGQVVSVDEPAVVFVPPGSSNLRVTSPGTVIRVIAAATAPQLAARCANSSEYEDGDSNVADFVQWPDPPDGYRIRVYPVAEHPIADGRLGRIFRCSTVMVNVLPESDDPRDPSKLSPHHHVDFEQVSLQVAGDYTHHMRVAWTPDATTWRGDEHCTCHAPAVVVIPPPLIHTSQAIGAMRHWLIDVFSPPRRDFSERPGWVLNADEYPMP